MKGRTVWEESDISVVFNQITGPVVDILKGCLPLSYISGATDISAVEIRPNPLHKHMSPIVAIIRNQFRTGSTPSVITGQTPQLCIT